MLRKIMKLCAVLFLCGAQFSLYAQKTASGSKEQATWNLVERSDFKRYDNGKYTGLVHREVRATINQAGIETGGYKPYMGNFIVLEETLRDMRASAQAVDNVISVHYKMAHNGDMLIENDKGYPELRNFPMYSISDIKSGKTKKGDTWTAQGKRAVDPLHNGETLVYPFLAEYEYKGVEDYKNMKVHHIQASFASRWNNVSDSYIKSINGKHNIDILMSEENGMLVLQRDNLDETFSFTNGNNVRFQGSILIFGTGLPAIDKPAIVTSIKSTPGIEVESVDAGLRLRIKDLQFKSDSDELLPSEEVRLDDIAKSLLQVKDRTFLVEGHTAHIGLEDNEQELSVKRAKRIVEEMEKRGIPAARFIYKGWGGTKPVGDNATDDGRKQNRRVEITILN
ncbi:MAG: OmpA family protein [Spirochaetaceae bacterium]|jgi:outer membrane protein OmpA-like peptidoglycan-associated protein|nr:OmpA family protein [Spirochaetaceae bacterium]